MSTSTSPTQTPSLAATPTNTTTPTTTTPRKIRKSYAADVQSEGVGSQVRRSIGIPQLRNFSPFLMLDHFSTPRGAGFPDHPHRGQETVTYLLRGAVDHEDFAGNKGMLGEGDLQFMTAGRGIVHAEMPRHDFVNKKGENESVEVVEGMQLWIDLATEKKMCEPRYRDLRAEEVPSVTLDDGKVEVKVISGESHGTVSVQELAYTPVWLLDVSVKPGGKITQRLPERWNAFAYVLKGTASFGANKDTRVVERWHNVVFEQEGDSIVIEVDEGAEEAAQIIIVAGTPLDQKVVQYGPFVLNSQAEVRQALFDYQGFTNGFERARDWESEIGKTFVQ